MTVLLENPVPVIIAGVVLESVLAVVLVQTGRKWPVYMMLGVLVICVSLVALEATVVTDREEVAETLFAVESAVSANDVDAVIGFVSISHGQEMARSIRNRMPRVTIHSANVGRDLKIEMNYLTPVPSAVATFTGRVTVSDKQGFLSHANYFRKFTVKLRNEGGQWRLYDYDERNPIVPGSNRRQ